MEKISILVVEDEKNIANIIKAYLEKEDYEVKLAYDGESGWKLFNSSDFTLVLLDLMLPKISGEDLCMKIRAKSNIPIIMLTAKVDEESKIEGLSIGADDYITKPFSPRELVSRVKALLRRTYGSNMPMANKIVLNNGDLEIDIDKLSVKKQGKLVNLTTNEFKILLSLLSNPGQVFSRDQLIEKSFGFDYDGFDRTIDTHIKNIRQKIETNPKEPQYIITVYGAGYKAGGI